jgi:hypothetical protein
MTKLYKSIVTGAAASAMLLQAIMPAFAATTIEITGNGAGSDNWTTVSQSSTTTVTQNNTANVTNNVDADAKTGGNDANFNTGGDVYIHTGAAKVEASVENSLNTNSAEVDCCSTAGATEVKISDNGAFSENGVGLTQTTRTTVDQDNTANVTNNVDADAKTGDNDAYKNTGGDVTVVTGDAKADVSVVTSANVNVAEIKTGAMGSSNPSASFVISGNGAGSDNYITAVLAKTTRLDHDNRANVTNDVDADAKTGGNDAGFNTGGDAIIGTGDAKVIADVDNEVNFNVADADCGCTWDVLAKIAGNGAEACDENKDDMDNIIKLDLISAQVLGQDNLSYLHNDLTDLDAFTGWNDVESNTAEVDGGDPAIVTGDATVESGVSNSGNVNTIGNVGSVTPFPMPDWSDYDFTFNMAALWAFFGMSA